MSIGEEMLDVDGDLAQQYNNSAVLCASLPGHSDALFRETLFLESIDLSSINSVCHDVLVVGRFCGGRPAVVGRSLKKKKS